MLKLVVKLSGDFVGQKIKRRYLAVILLAGGSGGKQVVFGSPTVDEEGNVIGEREPRDKPYRLTD